MRDKLGICQWFHYEDDDTVDAAVALLRRLGVRHLRTGISWADYHRPNGRAWYRRMFERLAEFDLLVSVWHTPPSIAEGGACSGPPRRLLDFADFIWQVNRDYGEFYETLELWNEPNNRYKWDFERFDPDWRKFAHMIAPAAYQAKADGKTTVLGGMMPVDPAWLVLLDSHEALGAIDVVAIHSFPGMWWDDRPNWDWYRHWRGWPEKIGSIAEWSEGRPVWVTETGLATWDFPSRSAGHHDKQVHALRAAAEAPAERIYWYSLIDLDPRRDAIEGFHVDENEYHLGLVDWRLREKPAFDEFQRLLAAAPPIRALTARNGGW